MHLSDCILFIDAEAVVIDKPAGLPVDAPKRGGDSIIARLDELKCGFERPPVPMHRLDRDTSGCLLFARNPRAVKHLQRAFETGRVEKTYLALVDGTLAEAGGRIELPLSKYSTAADGWRMVPHETGKSAVTQWRRIAERDGRSLVEFRPLTGRTHQIRAHALNGLGAAVVGDPVYGDAGGPMMLHALRLVVPRERKAAIDVAAPLPPHFAAWADAA